MGWCGRECPLASDRLSLTPSIAVMPGQGYYYAVRGLLYKWLNRRGKQGCCSWEKFRKLLLRYPLPTPRVMVKLF